MKRQHVGAVEHRHGVIEAFREYAECYQAIAEIMVDYAYVVRVETSGELICEWVTDTFERVTGYIAHDMLQTVDLWIRLLHPDDHWLGQKRKERLLANQPDVSELRLITSSGETRWIRDYAQPVWDNIQGRVKRIYGAVQDVTEQRRQIEALQVSEAHYRAIVQDQSELICRFQCDGTLTFVNESYCRYFGQSCTALRGQNFMHLIPETDWDLVQHHLESLNADRPTVTCEHRVIEADGTTCWQQWTDHAICNNEGQVIAYQAVGRDITQQKQVEAQLRLAQFALDHAADLVLGMDRWGHIIYVNHTVCRTTGHDRTILLGMMIHELDAAAQTGSWNILLNALDGTDTLTFEANVRRRDGSVFPVEVTANQVEVDEITYIYAFARDITERKRIEQAQQAHEEHMRTMTIKHIHLYETERQRVQQLHALRDTMTEIIGELEPDKLLHAILERAIALLHATCGELSLYDAQRDDLMPLAYHDQRGEHAGPRQRWHSENSRWVVASRKPLIVPYGADPALPASRYLHDQESAAHVMLLMPLLVGADLVGVISIEDADTTRTFSHADVELLELFAQQATIAIQNARLYEAAQRRAAEAETLQQAGAIVTSTLNQAEAIARILEQLACVVAHDSASVQLLRGNEFEIVGVCGYADPQAIIGLCIPLTSQTPNFVAYQQRRPYILGEVPAADVLFHLVSPQTRCSWMGAPLIIQERMIGMLTLHSLRLYHFTEEHARLVMAFTHHVSIALENARLFSEIQQLATIDPLMGLYNRRHFFELAYNEFERAVRYARPLSILMIDVDDFKKINDTYGHLVGDQVLRVIAEQCRLTLRTVDVVGRYGGEELVALLPETDIHDVRLAAERLRQNLAQTVIRSDIRNLFITASLGVSTYNGACDHSLEMLIDRADQALYLAKHLGKNRVVVWEEDMFSSGSVLALHQALQTEYHNQAQTLAHTTQPLNANLDLATVLKTVCDEVLRLSGVSAATLQLYDTEQDALVLKAASGLKLRSPELQQVTPRIAYDIHAEQGEQVMYVRDRHHFANWPDADLYLDLDVQTLISMPLRQGNELIGRLNVLSREADYVFTPEQLAWLHDLTGQAVPAIVNARQFDELVQSYESTLLRWIRALDMRNREPDSHTQQVTTQTVRLAQMMGLREPLLTHVRRGALLHDIGKLAIPDTILHKPVPFTPEEWTLVRQHPVYAYDLLAPISFLQPALDIPLYHHERWNGSGYPHGLQAQAIPLPARIFAVVDVWDILRSERPYRPGWSDTEVSDYLREQAGKQFDPQVVEVFFQLLDQTTG